MATAGTRERLVADILRTSPETGRRWRCRARLALALAGLAMGLVACRERMDRPLTAPSGESGPGRILYLTYCESCHGASGRGDGPAAGSLRTPPADLTRLFARYGTPLGRKQLAKYVDGRALFDAHGPREMPIWGSEFFADAPPTTPNLEGVRGRLIEVLVEYVETLQTERQL